MVVPSLVLSVSSSAGHDKDLGAEAIRRFVLVGMAAVILRQAGRKRFYTLGCGFCSVEGRSVQPSAAAENTDPTQPGLRPDPSLFRVFRRFRGSPLFIQHEREEPRKKRMTRKHYEEKFIHRFRRFPQTTSIPWSIRSVKICVICGSARS